MRSTRRWVDYQSEYLLSVNTNSTDILQDILSNNAYQFFASTQACFNDSHKIDKHKRNMNSLPHTFFTLRGLPAVSYKDRCVFFLPMRITDSGVLTHASGVQNQKCLWISFQSVAVECGQEKVIFIYKIIMITYLSTYWWKHCSVSVFADALGNHLSHTLTSSTSTFIKDVRSSPVCSCQSQKGYSSQSVHVIRQASTLISIDRQKRMMSLHSMHMTWWFLTSHQPRTVLSASSSLSFVCFFPCSRLLRCWSRILVLPLL